MVPYEQSSLSRRERQIMDIIYEHGESSAQEVLNNIENPPSYSSIRALIARLVEKEMLEYRVAGTKHIYFPKINEQRAQKSAVQRLLKTFFKGSRANAVAALLDSGGESLTIQEIEQLERSIERIKKMKRD